MIRQPMLIDDLEKCDGIVQRALDDVKPTFLARVGGSDTDLLIDLHNLSKTFSKQECLRRSTAAIDTLKRYNGYYDLTNDPENIFRFYDIMLKSFTESTEIFLVGSSLLSEFLPNSIHEQFKIDNGIRKESIRSFIIDAVTDGRKVSFLPYAYIERLTLGTTIFSQFSKVLSGKKILVISPFKQSIEANFHNRSKFFKNYNYPHFDLLTYEAPITYPGLPPSFYPDRDWFETEKRMRLEISRFQFDIALLSCGSYAMPLGSYIASELNRKAIYIGGCLQLFFGIIGRRYENPFFLAQINRQHFIKPLESERYLSHASLSPDMAAEAFGAYF